MEYKKAKEELLRIYGVGEKVADCICLFSLHHLDAFPVDTHIRQALDAHYKRGFPNRRYKGMRGVIQQYIFYYELFGYGTDSQKSRKQVK
jgi:N-glycosylase/DNA lyase